VKAGNSAIRKEIKRNTPLTEGKRFDTAVPDDVITIAGFLQPLPYPTA
jgi:hypothetical protein